MVKGLNLNNTYDIFAQGAATVEVTEMIESGKMEALKESESNIFNIDRHGEITGANGMSIKDFNKINKKD